MQLRGPVQHRDERYPLSWRDVVVGGLWAVGSMFLVLVVCAVIGIRLQMASYHVAFLGVGSYLALVGIWWPWWMRRWEQLTPWRFLFGDRGARIAVIGAGLIAMAVAIVRA